MGDCVSVFNRRATDLAVSPFHRPFVNLFSVVFCHLDCLGFPWCVQLDSTEHRFTFSLKKIELYFLLGRYKNHPFEPES